MIQAVTIFLITEYENYSYKIQYLTTETITCAHVLCLRLAYVGGLSHDHWIGHGDKNAVAALP